MKKKYCLLLLIIIVLFTIFTIKQNKKINTKKDDWMNVEENVKYFKKENVKRYKKYKEKFPNKKLDKIIIEVNIGLDRPFYEGVEPSNIEDDALILVNKYNYLKNDYSPDKLEKIDNTSIRKDAYAEFINMKKDAKKLNLNIIAISGYRSYNYQNKLYNNYVNTDGVKLADTYSARPGFSEHQTGLAIDVCNGKTPYTDFEKTKEFEWMRDNAYKYGFIVRYPKEKENITGYMYEPWHYRYVGVKASTYIKKNNITYEEYYVMFVKK